MSNNTNTIKDNTKQKDLEFTEKLVHINRFSKVVKGGRRFSFAALVVVGDQNGSNLVLFSFNFAVRTDNPRSMDECGNEVKPLLFRVERIPAQILASKSRFSLY